MCHHPLPPPHQAVAPNEIVSFTNCFHGRTMGALALTYKEQYKTPFLPVMPGAVLAEYNNLDSAAKVGGGVGVVLLFLGGERRGRGERGEKGGGGGKGGGGNSLMGGRAVGRTQCCARVLSFRVCSLSLALCGGGVCLAQLSSFWRTQRL